MASCFGFIGCGMMGQEHLRNLTLLGSSKVTNIFEPDPVMRAECIRLVPDAHFAQSEEEVICSDQVEALIITSPNYPHSGQLERIASL